jgi:hypothetical protein
VTRAAELLTTPFGFASTAAEVVEGLDLTGTRAIVTGAASGIGVETARALAGAGAEVTLAVRDTDAGARTAADIAATTDGATPRVEALDARRRASRRSTWPTGRPWRRSSRAGTGRCTCSSTTRASWRSRR